MNRMHNPLIQNTSAERKANDWYGERHDFNIVSMKEQQTNEDIGVFGSFSTSNTSIISMTDNDDRDKMAVAPPHTSFEDSLSKGLLKLSITDRNAVEEEIHGVQCLGIAEETPDLLQMSLEEFNHELLSIKNSPSRMASLENEINRFHNRKKPSKSISQQHPPIDVLKNVIDTTALPQNGMASSNNGTSETTAAQQCYLNDPDVRLRFLRCENFDARAGAKRFVNFLDLAKEAFGNCVAERPIRLSDFLESSGGRRNRYQQHEKKALSGSRIQYLPFRDRSGRRVKVAVGECNSDLDLMLRLKINLLLDWIASEDVETQQKGVVIVIWPSDPPSTNAAPSGNSSVSSGGGEGGGITSGSESEDESSKWETYLRPKYTQNHISLHKRYYDAQPLRVAAMHWCSQDKPIYRVLNSLFYFSLDSRSQSRYKVHFGEPLEIRYSLQAYGIAVDLLPLTHTMALKRQNHTQWMSCRKYIEDQQEQQQHQQQQQQFQHNYQQQQRHYQQQNKFQQQQFRQLFLQQPMDDERAMQFFESSFGSGSSPNSSPNSRRKGGGNPIVIECPRSYDVIIGKAKVCTNNPGNGFYSSLIEATHDEHDAMIHARDKVAMTWRILLHITEERKGQFLDWNKSLNAWVVIQDKIVIRKKIANSYKEYKRSRYVTARSASGSHKKKEAPPTSDDDELTAHNHTTKNSSSRDTSKRRKITGCLGYDSRQNDIESMFAGL